MSSDAEVRRALEDPYTLTHGSCCRARARPAARRAVAARPRDRAGAGRYLDDRILMAPVNTRVVRRSNALQDWAYGRRFRYSECQSLGSSIAGACRVGGGDRCRGRGHRTGQPLFRQSAARTSSSGFAAEAGYRTERTAPANAAHYTIETYTTTTTGARYRATMSQKGDPGYKATSVLLGRKRVGARAGPRQAVRSARRIDARGGDGRRAARSIPRCRCVIGDCPG